MHAPLTSPTGNTVVNYDGAIVATPQKLVRPASVAEIADVLTDAATYPSPVRAKGSYHSLTPCASSDGTIIDMRGMDAVVEIDRQNLTFTAQAGMEFVAAARALREAGLQFITNIEIGNMTLGAAACCHTKDGLDGAEFGQVGSYVTQIRWVAPDGRLREASEAGDPALLRRMRTSYGLAGVIYEVTFRVKPIGAVHFTYLPRPSNELTQQEVDGIIDHAEGLVCWTVGRTAVFQTRRETAQAGPFGALFAALRRRMWNYTEAHGGRFVDKYFLTQGLKDAGLAIRFVFARLLMHILRLVGGARILAPDKTVDYSDTPQSARYAFTFWTFPRARWLETLRAYLDFAEAYRQRTGFRCNMALGSYFVRKDTNALLSYSHDGDMFSIDPIHAPTDQAAWDAFLRAFNAFAFEHGGTPLLNQSPFVTRAHVQQAYGARWQEFSNWVRREDPAGRMLNPFFAELLDPPPAAS